MNNTIPLRTLGLSILLATSLTACKDKAAAEPAAADATATATAPAAAPDAMAAPEPAATSEAPAEAMAIPDTADGIWTAIDTHSAELKATIAGGDLKQVHHHAFAIRDLVAALPAHSPTLSTEDQAKLKGEVGFVTTLADRLDESGDASDKAATQASYDQLVGVLAGITRNK